MAEDETKIKVIFEADTSSIEDALKKTQKEAQRAAQKGSSFDKKAIDTSHELRKEAVRAAKFNDNSFAKSVKSNNLEVRQLGTQKQQFKVQLTSNKVFTQQNKSRTNAFVLSNKLLKNEQGIVKAQTVGLAKQKQAAAVMKNLQASWKKNQDSYGGLQAARRAGAAATAQHIGNRWTPPPGGGEEPDEGNKKERSSIGPMVRQVAGVLASALKQVVDFTIQPMMQGYQAYLQYGSAAGRTIGQGNLGDVNFGRAQSLAFDRTETAGQAYGVARATGKLGAVNTAQEAARFYGGSVEETTGVMGSLTRGGQGFNSQGGGAGRAQLHRLLRDATASGLDRSRVGEHLEAVASAVEATGSSLAGDVDASQISGLLAMIGSTGRSGFQGARGMNVLSQIDQGVKSGGRDEYSQAMQLAAFGFGVPGRDTDYFTARGRQEQGIFGNGGSQNLLDTVNMYRGMSGNRQEQIIGMQDSGSFGNLTQSQIGGLMDAVDSAGGDMTSVEAAIDALRTSQGSVEEQIRDNLKSGQALVAQRVVDLNNRLVDIGENVFPAMANIQDAVVDVQNTLLPMAITALQAISATVTTIRDMLGTLPGMASPADVDPIMAADRAATVIRDQAFGTNNLDEARDLLAQFRQIEREVDNQEHALYRAGNTGAGGLAQALGTGLSENENQIQNHISTLEQIRAAEQRANALQPAPAATAIPVPVQVTVQTGPTNVNVPGSQPNASRDPMPPGSSGVYTN